MPFENLRPIRINPETPGIIPPSPSLSKEASVLLGNAILKTVSQENPIHPDVGHRLDKVSAEAGLLTTDGKAEELSPDDFENWTHAGNTPDNPWRQLDLVRQPGDKEDTAFINSYQMESGVKKALTDRGVVTHPKAKGDEIEWHIPEELKQIEESTIVSHVSDRFRQGTDFIVHWIDPKETSRKDKAMLRRIGFKRIYSEKYAGEQDISVCYVIDRSSYARAMLDNMAKKPRSIALHK